MWEDVKPVPHIHAKLIKHYAELMSSGEIEAEHFILQARPKHAVSDWFISSAPSWSEVHEYRIVEGKNHPSKRHDALKAEWEKVRDKGTHNLFVEAEFGFLPFIKGAEPLWSSYCNYEIRPIAKPKLQLIDKTKLPIGTMTNYGRLMTLSERWDCQCYSNENGTYFLSFSDLRIKPMSEWLSWHGGECPVPKGLEVRVQLRSGIIPKTGLSHAFMWEHLPFNGDIINYQIVGIANGWTDDPALAV